jgi:putative transposase
MVSPSTKRRAVTLSVEAGLGSAAATCRALGLARSSFYRLDRQSVESRRVRKEILGLSRQHPRYGYRRITALLRRDGLEVNAKRVQRIRRQEALQVSKRQRRMKRLGVSTSVRQRAARTNDVWSWDFVEDQTENGSRFRMLTLIDEHTRRCLAVHASWSIRAVDVITIVEAAIERYGRPQHLRSDNGPEFIAYAIQDWLKAQEIKTIYIRPGSPWENGHIESFHDKLRDECLNRELFGSLLEAQIILEQWRHEYNDQRPHSSLGYLTPAEYTRRARGAGLRSPSGLPTSSTAQRRTQTTNKPVGLQL